MDENKHGILTIEDEPVYRIVRQYRFLGSKEDVARVCLIEVEDVEEAIRFFQKYPEEIYRDIVKGQLKYYRQEIQEREDALDMFLETCDECGNGEYTWSEASVMEEDLLSSQLCTLECPNCGFEPN